MYSLKTSSGYDASQKFIGGAGAAAQAMREKILNAPNTEDIYEISGTKYYISRDMSIDDRPKDLKSGDAVLFERGGLWRIPCREDIIVPDGVIFGAYGTGEKPKFYGSAADFAGSPLWKKHSENIWEMSLPGRDVGIIVFDEKYALGDKKRTLDEVAANYDFYYDGDSEELYLCYSGDLITDFRSIEIGQRGNLFEVYSNGVVDNFCVRYGASHGICVHGNADNVMVTNCEIGFIGGSLQFGTTRFGNGIEAKLGGSNITAKDNWVYQCYDAGVTFQSWNTGEETHYENIDFSDNLIENCYYAIEFFTTNSIREGIHSSYKNIKFKNNIMRFSGYCWSHEQREDKWFLSHIRSSQRAYIDYCEDFEIKNNIFDSARAYVVFWWWNELDGPHKYHDSHPGLTVSGNTFYQCIADDNRVLMYHSNQKLCANNEEELVGYIKRFDPEPKSIILLEKP